MKSIVYLNGQLLSLDDAGLPIFTPGFLNGIGYFESMRSYGKRIVYLDEHISRLKESASFVGIKINLSSGKIKRIIDRIVSQNNIYDAYVRITAWKQEKGAGILIVAKKYTPYPERKYREGFRLGISRLRQDEESLLCRHKTINRLLYEISFRQAKEKGLDEALILNNKGYIAEATRSNVFLVKDKEIFTPSLDCGCLDGITRKIVFKLAKKNNIKLYEGKFTAYDLIKSDEAFLTNSLMGVMPVKSLENRRIGKPDYRKLTKFFIRKYNFLLKNGS